MAKPVYKCELIEIRNKHAVIRRKEAHNVLGEPRPDTVTLTSEIVKHDAKTRTIETQNSFYKY